MINTVKSTCGERAQRVESNGHKPLPVRQAGNIDVEKVVRERYAKGARRKEEALCCPVTYDPKFLKVIPQEILEKDYGCGDPSAYLKEGETVLDLGSGAGKICFIASQVVGPKGRVIGIDFNPSMLSLANKHKGEVAKKIGWKNVEFRRGRIQDLKTDLDGRSLIPDESIDVIVSNCVLNLVKSDEKRRLFGEMHRVLKKGGRIAISDIVSDEMVSENLQSDPKLWSGCISGAFEEKAFLKAFEDAGFYGIKIEKRDEKPWQVVAGIEFRSVTVVAYKGKEGECWEKNQAVIYKGPWKEVRDDDHHVLKRGVRTAVCDKTYQIYSKTPYQNEFILVPPSKDVPLSKAKPFDCSRDVERSPKETKGSKYKANVTVKSSCLDGGCC